MSLKDLVLQRLENLEVRPKKSMGQNFLISEHVVNEIFETVNYLSPKFIIEVGPGLGVLTETLLQRGYSHLLLEMDSTFCNYWRQRNANIIETDALKFNWDQEIPESNTLLLSNLPYQIGSRLVVHLCTATDKINQMVLMFQKEVAQRMVAKPKTKEYGLLTVLVQTHWSVEKVVDAPAGDFYPPPKVDSRVLKFKRLVENSKYDIKFTQFIKRAFLNRRKFMVKSFGDEKDFLMAALSELNLLPSVRAEEIDVIGFQKLFLLFEQAKGKSEHKNNH